MNNKSEKRDLTGVFFWRSYYARIKMHRLFDRLVGLIVNIRGVRTGKNVIFNGVPLIRRFPNSSISIGDNCNLNSARRSLLVGLLRRCTFVTLTEDAMIVLGKNVGISGGLIVAASKIEIGDNVLIGANCSIFDNDVHPADPKERRRYDNIPTRPVIIEDNVFIGANSFLLKGITVGRNSIIGANSVVISSIPANSIAIGNPCKVVIRKNWED